MRGQQRIIPVIASNHRLFTQAQEKWKAQLRLEPDMFQATGQERELVMGNHSF